VPPLLNPLLQVIAIDVADLNTMFSTMLIGASGMFTIIALPAVTELSETP
jgi:hypothetical protein